MQEIKVTKAIINERDELIVSFLVKQEDYSIAEAKIFKDAKKLGNFLDIELSGILVVDQNEERNKRLQTLWGLISLYCEKRNVNEKDWIKERIYDSYWIASRKQLSDSEIDYEIERYKAGLQEFTN